MIEEYTQRTQGSYSTKPATFQFLHRSPQHVLFGTGIGDLVQKIDDLVLGRFQRLRRDQTPQYRCRVSFEQNVVTIQYCRDGERRERTHEL